MEKTRAAGEKARAAVEKVIAGNVKSECKETLMKEVDKKNVQRPAATPEPSFPRKNGWLPLL